ncbi:MAG: glycosyltransferase [Silicimonas sp.]|nr:glycosyltransferase [Silicimonas sp.]
MSRVSIAVCTYRRESVLETLQSLMEITLPKGVETDIMVIDNDVTPSARDRVETFAETAPRPVRYVHAPAGNISVARNAALNASDARFLAFIDDDEVASRTWLSALMAARDHSGVDIVLGPVAAVYPDAAPDWMREENLHATLPVEARGEIRTGYSGNVLIDRACKALDGLRFDPALGETGGEDTIFFAMAHDAGGRIGFAADALVTEAVLPSRLSLKWLSARRLRSGRTHARLLLQIERRTRWGALLTAVAKAGYCAFAMALWLPVTRRRNVAALRFLFHAGVCLELLQSDAPSEPALDEVRP